jgi:hypothetical protein
MDTKRSGAKKMSIYLDDEETRKIKMQDERRQEMVLTACAIGLALLGIITMIYASTL